MSSETDSCNNVNPVTYAQPAPAPSVATSTSVGVSDDTQPVAMIAMPVPITAPTNTDSRGNRRCTAKSVTTPSAAPTPSAVISRPNAEGPPPSTSRAKSGPSGTMHAATEQAAREPDHDPADEGIRPHELQPVADVAECLTNGDPLHRAPLVLLQPQPRDQQRRDEERRQQRPTEPSRTEPCIACRPSSSRRCSSRGCGSTRASGADQAGPRFADVARHQGRAEVHALEPAGARRHDRSRGRLASAAA